MRGAALVLLLVVSCASAPKPVVLPTSVPKGALEAICLRLHDEGMSGSLRVVGSSQPLITRAALQAMAEAAFFRGNVDPESVNAAVSAPPIPVDDIVEKYLKLTIEFDDTHRLFKVPRSDLRFDLA